MSRGPLLKATGISRTFAGQSALGSRNEVVTAVDGVSFELRNGETLGLVGESGSGKSTTGRLALGMMQPTQGTVHFRGTDMSSLRGRAWRSARREMQMIFQDPSGALDPRMTIGEQLSEVIAVYDLAATASKRRDMMRSILERVGLCSDTYANRYPRELSGGQRQRAVIARALVIRPRMIVCDEPVSALDVSVQAQIVELLISAQADDDCAYLFISHDLRVVRQVSHRVAVMYLGRIVETAPVNELFKSPQHPYTRALLAAVPSIDDDPGEKTVQISGEPPNPRNIPGGCRFHPRCPLARDICRIIDPGVVMNSAGHEVACHLASFSEAAA